MFRGFDDLLEMWIVVFWYVLKIRFFFYVRMGDVDFLFL